MNYIGIVLVSHSDKVANGIKEIIREVILDVPLVAAGGTDEGEIGTSVSKISEAIEQAYSDKGVLIFYDLGSAKMNAEIAIEMSDRKNIHLVEAPLLEGSYVGAVESSMGKALEEVMKSLNTTFPGTSF